MLTDNIAHGGSDEYCNVSMSDRETVLAAVRRLEIDGIMSFACDQVDIAGEEFRPKNFYQGLVAQGHGRASDCVACGQCEGVCPQHLPIIELLKEAAEAFDKAK